MTTREQRRQLSRENDRLPTVLALVPRDEWPEKAVSVHRTRVWRSRHFLVQEFTAAWPALVRLSINRSVIDDMRAIAVKHMGMGQGNPTYWVVMALHEAFQRGFGVGFAAGQHGTQAPPAAPVIQRTQYYAQEYAPESRISGPPLLIEDAKIVVSKD